MTSEMESTPFVKQLAAGDRPTREKALALLTTYLTSGRTFTQTELLKIWKGLFYTIHHTDRPLPQQRLARSLTDILLALPQHLFLPFLAAFWTTLIAHYSAIPSLRLDKYLYLVRLYVAGTFTYLEREGRWEDDAMMQGWTDVVTGRGQWEGKGCGVLDVRDAKVPDGLRYHVLDVWVDGLVKCERWEEEDVRKRVMGVVQDVAENGATKVLRQRAKSALEDLRLRREGEERGERVTKGGVVGEEVVDNEGEEFEGFGD